MQYKNIEILIGFAVFILLYISDNIFWTSVGIGFFVWISFHFFFNIGKTIDIRDLTVLIPSIQWILGPWLSYNFSTDQTFYYMVINESDYMSFIVPSMLMFAFGMYVRVKKEEYNITLTIAKIKEIVTKYQNLDLVLIFIGTIAVFLTPYVPSFLRFFIHLLKNVQFVGLFMLFLNNRRKLKKATTFSVILFMSVIAVSNGMFHILLLWFVFLFIVISFINKVTFLKKLQYGFLIFFIAFFIQSIKHEYRNLTWNEDGKIELSDKASIFTDLIVERVNRKELLTSETNKNSVISRINQGWIVARVINHVPAIEPFCDGETIKNALLSSLLPRFLSPDKKKAGGKDNFERFTGHKLIGGTSMNLSVVGEGYANYGYTGGIVFMFFFGLLINIAYKTLMNKTKTFSTLLFFIPLIFLQVVKAESDFGTVLNHLIKATVFVFIIRFGFKVIFKIKI